MKTYCNLAPGDFVRLASTAQQNGDAWLDDQNLSPALRNRIAQAASVIRRSQLDIAGSCWEPSQKPTTTLAKILGADDVTASSGMGLHTLTLRATEALTFNESDGAFLRWMEAQSEDHPTLHQVLDGFVESMYHAPEGRKCKTAAHVWAVALGESEKILGSNANFSDIACHALFACAGASIGLPADKAWKSNSKWPGYLSDGRDGDCGYDKTQHFFAQALYAYVILQSRLRGDLKLAKAFESVVDRENVDGLANAILDAHETTPWNVGPLLYGALVMPSTKDRHFEFPSAGDLTPVERRAARYAELLGAVHELNTTGKKVQRI